MIRRPPRSTLFPSRRSSDLFALRRGQDAAHRVGAVGFHARIADVLEAWNRLGCSALELRRGEMRAQDRKSTRLNSSHTVISYAVFCLKKKKNKRSSEHAVRQ